MPTTHTLPGNPSLSHLREQARTLQRAVRAGDTGAAARVGRQHPDGVPADPASFPLTTAQLVIAREYGFASWPRLRGYLDLVAQHGWDSTPARQPAGDPAGGLAGDPAGGLADELCRLACLSYRDDDGPDRWAQARQLLADRPELTSDHIWAAAAAGQSTTVRRLLANQPARARQRGGPYQWTPLCYLAYSRLDPDVPAEPVLDAALALLDAGADPDEGYLWDGRPYPFTLLTGVFGEGELGPQHQPRHPHSLPLARLLLAAGANPNDSQTLYNRQFRPGNEHLELLFQYGLGTGETYPWRDRLGDLLDTPAGLLRVQLRWAVEHDFRDRVALLVRHGVDVRSPFHAPAGTVAWHPDDGRTPVELAALSGHCQIVDFLLSQGVPPPRFDPDSELIAAVFRADRAAADRLREAHPGVAARIRRARPGLIVWAAARGRTETVALLAELGFDVNARGRGDVPVEGGPDTALHHAAARGDLELVRVLLSLGADPNIVGGYHSTPLGWARHFDRRSVVALLSRLTDQEPAGGG